MKNQKRTYTYRWARGLPLRGGDDALLVNWLSLEIRKPNGDVTYRGAWVTDLDVNASNIEELVLCARTRWKIENENFNVLKEHITEYTLTPHRVTPGRRGGCGNHPPLSSVERALFSG